MEEIFKVEFHPIDGMPTRIRFLERAGSHHIERVTERRDGDSWTLVDSEIIDYFEYSDDDLDLVSL